jgi:hypothetical protein
MSSRADGNKTDWLPAATALRIWKLCCIKIKSPHLAGSGLAIPTREAQCRNKEIGIGWWLVSGVGPAKRTVIRRGAKAGDTEQSGKSRLESLELLTVGASHHSTKAGIPLLKPVI